LVVADLTGIDPADAAGFRDQAAEPGARQEPGAIDDAMRFACSFVQTAQRDVIA
jgi:hypothetical protein